MQLQESIEDELSIYILIYLSGSYVSPFNYYGQITQTCIYYILVLGKIADYTLYKWKYLPGL